MAVTLAAPVSPQVIEAEADLEQLEELGIARVSVELRYKQFGKLFTDHKGLALSLAAGEPVVDKTVYRDAGADSIEYRLIFHHKQLGKIKEPKWQPVEGDYIYCAPGELLLNQL